MDTVVALAECPHIDVNWQDSEGNTALITAAQAGKSWPSFSLQGAAAGQCGPLGLLNASHRDGSGSARACAEHVPEGG